jgi:3-oxoadipate enol-lactonase
VQALVLSNALGSTSMLWDRQVPALERDFSLLRYEHRARESMAEHAQDVVALLDERDVERASFCGVSLGGAVGMQLALDAPERVDRLVLASTSARFGDPQVWRERAELVRREGTMPVVDATLDRWFTPRFQEREPFREMLLGGSRDVYAACCEAIARWDARDRLHETATPTLVIAGEHDPTAGPEHASVLAESIPDARLVVLSDAAHVAQVEQADEWNEAVLEFLQ